MNTIDLTAYSVLGLVAAFPAVRAAAVKLWPRFIAAPTPAAQASRTQHWTALLLQLVEELEDDGAADAAELGRELIWRLIGGQPDSQPEKKK